MRLRVLTIGLWIWALAIPHLQAQRAYFRAFGPADGLPAGIFNSMAIDPRGQHWLAGANGLFSFDGQYFEAPSLQGPMPRDAHSLLFDGQGRGWMGTLKGLYRWEQGQLKAVPPWEQSFVGFLAYESNAQQLWIGHIMADTLVTLSLAKAGDPSLQPAQELSRSVIFMAQASDQTIWVSFLDSLRHIGPEGVVTHHLPEGLARRDCRVVSASGAHDALAYVERPSALYRYRNGQWHPLPLPPSAYPIAFTNGGLIDRQGNAWIVNSKSELYRIGLAGDVEVFTQKNGLPPGAIDVLGLWEDRHGNIWMLGNNPSAWAKPAPPFRHFGPEQGLGNAFVRCIFEDQQQRLWIGTLDGQLYCLRNGALEKKIAKGPFRYVRAMLQMGEEEFWLGTSEGLWQYHARTGQLQPLGPQYGLPTNGRISHLLHFNDSVLIASDQNTFIAKNGRARAVFPDGQHPYTKASNYFWKESEDVAWIFSPIQIAKMRGGRMEEVVTAEQPIHPMQAVQDRWGRIWVACYGIGLGLLEQGKLSFLTEKDGLSSGLAYNLLQDRAGHLWLGHQTGVDRIRFDPSGKLRDITAFGAHDGFVGGENNAPAALCDGQGQLWWGTVGGLMAYHPQRELPERPVAAYLAQVQVFGQPTEWRQEPYSRYCDSLSRQTGLPANLQLPDYMNRLSFVFGSDNPLREGRLFYRYRLEGHEGAEGWSAPSHAHAQAFADLAPGHYALHLQASNSTDFSQAPSVAFQFRIRPPFWQTWWFAALAAGLLALLALALKRMAENRELRRQMAEWKTQQLLAEERRRISQDMHDDIGSSLSKIAILSETIGRTMAGQGNAGQLAGKVSDTAREVIESLSEIIWNAQGENAQLGAWMAHLREKIADLLETAGLEGHISMPEQAPPERILPHLYRRNLLLVAKEALHNIVKHAQASKVEIEVRLEGAMWQMRLTDNGRGFDPNALPRVNGLHNMRQRMQEIGGDIEIDSAPGRGTRLALRCTLP
jgi:signal transduction histidine kinase/ligand-binding sensor domain-containing protein